MTDVGSVSVSTIPGWLPGLDRELFDLLLDRQSEPGDLAELGVFQGKSAVVIGAHRRPGETFTVVDLFEAIADDDENQRENTREYAGLSRARFEGHYRAALGELPEVVQGPSESIVDHAEHGTHRFVHIDASHLHEHVVADLAAARKLLAPEGVLVLDDIRSAHTPGVAAAAWAAVARDGLRPFAITGQKLYATWGDPWPWYDLLAEWAGDRPCETQWIDRQPVLRLWSVAPRAARWVPPVLLPWAARLRGCLGQAIP